MSENIIKIEDLTKKYRRFKKKEGIKGSIASLWKREYEEKTAVNQVSLSVRQGEFIGLVGPNGAGKTTLIKMMTGIIAPSSGRIDVLGYYPNDLKNSFKKKYAIVMGQKSQLFFELTVNDTLRLFKEIYEIPEEKFLESRDYFVQLFGVADIMDVQVRTLSLGERMKMELLTALLHNPEILFLDEPTIGLDAVAAKQIRKFLKEINRQRGTTIILTSHYMEDIKALCERTVVINHGMKIFDGRTSELFEKYQKNKRISVTFHNIEDNINLQTEITGVSNENPYKKVYEVARENSKALLAEIMEFNPDDIIIEEEEIGVIVERIYQEGGICNA
ncbi:MAG: ATP-binding cassette domain-containing protein [Lachnospiraceae bacterium]